MILEAWKRYFDVLKCDLANTVGKISFMSNVWSDSNHRPYLALTAHWIARDEATGAL
ncbi:hypothetical protein M405DRAFT_752922 [Rhizopogon salebrosus TDB-379]|nr:hypothetical protein M405DRAFT_752922 [Rhizopogon salebrosus TDB-379]